MSADPSTPKPEGLPAEDLIPQAIEHPDAVDQAWENVAQPAAATQPAELIDEAESPEEGQEMELELDLGKSDDPLPKATVPVQLPEAPATPAAAAADSPLPAPVEADAAVDQPVDPEPQSVPVTEGAPKPRGLSGWLGSLSMAEKFCCGAILAGILAFAGLVFLPALFDFPKEAELTKPGDFPLKGAQLEVRSAETYWEESATGGNDADDGIVILPVLDAKLQGKANVRVLFRDSEGEVTGDLLNFDLSGELEHRAICTSGFKERGNFTAYQAGQMDLWTVEMHEVPSTAGGISEQTLLFKMSISPTLKNPK